MAEDLFIATGNKTDLYKSLINQGLTEGETDLIANMANIAAERAIQMVWVGFI